MASYWKSPYSKLHLTSGRPDSCRSTHPSNFDCNSEYISRFRWFDNGLPKDFHRRLTTHSAITRREGSQIKGILKPPSEQDPLDLDRMSPYSGSNIDSFRGSVRSRKDKKRVTFDNGLEDDSRLQQSDTSSTYQPKLKLSQTLDDSAKYNLKRLLGHYSDHHWPTVRGRITLAKSQTYAPLQTNGLCRHSAYLKCASCFNRIATDKEQKETHSQVTNAAVLNTPENISGLSVESGENISGLSVESGGESAALRLNDVGANVSKLENSYNTTQRLNRPSSKTYLIRKKNLLIVETDATVFSREKSIQDASGYPSSDIQNNLEVLSKLTLTPDNKVRAVKTNTTENINFIKTKADTHKNNNILFHNHTHKKTSLKLSVSLPTDVDRTLQLPKCPFSKQYVFPHSLEQHEMTDTRLENSS